MNWLKPSTLVALAFCCLSIDTGAQAFPSKPFHIVVPFPAGGTADTLARTLAEQLVEQWGQPVLVDNRPGAGSIVATLFVQRAPADGYTVLMVAPSFLVNPMLNPDAKYDAARDFVPVALAVTSPLVLAVHPSLPARSMKELIDLVKASPGKAQLRNRRAGLDAADDRRDVEAGSEDGLGLRALSRWRAVRDRASRQPRHRSHRQLL